MNSDSKSHQADPRGPHINHPAHLGAPESFKVALKTPDLTGLQGGGTVSGYK